MHTIKRRTITVTIAATVPLDEEVLSTKRKKYLLLRLLEENF